MSRTVLVEPEVGGVSPPDIPPYIRQLFRRNKTLARLAFLLSLVASGALPLTLEAFMKTGSLSRRAAYDYLKVVALATLACGSAPDTLALLSENPSHDSREPLMAVGHDAG